MTLSLSCSLKRVDCPGLGVGGGTLLQGFCLGFLTSVGHLWASLWLFRRSTLSPTRANQSFAFWDSHSIHALSHKKWTTGGTETQVLTLYASDHKRLQLIAINNKYLLVVNLCDESSIFAGGKVQLQALPELDIIKQSTKLLQRSNVPSLHAARMRWCHVQCISPETAVLE